MYHPHLNCKQSELIIGALAAISQKHPDILPLAIETVKAFNSQTLMEMFDREAQFWRMIGQVNKITWTCHACGKERADADIAVFKRDISERFHFPPGTVTENVRYCADNWDCRTKAQEKRFIFT